MMILNQYSYGERSGLNQFSKKVINIHHVRVRTPYAMARRLKRFDSIMFFSILYRRLGMCHLPGKCPESLMSI